MILRGLGAPVAQQKLRRVRADAWFALQDTARLRKAWLPYLLVQNGYLARLSGDLLRNIDLALRALSELLKEQPPTLRATKAAAISEA